MKAIFLRDDGRVEDVCVLPLCYSDLLAQSQRRRSRALRERGQARGAAFEKLMEAEEATLLHLHCLLWLLLHEFNFTVESWRERAGLPPYDGRPAVVNAEWQVLSSWPYERALSAIFELAVGGQAALPAPGSPAAPAGEPGAGLRAPPAAFGFSWARGDIRAVAFSGIKTNLSSA